jgi:hypothetical protein
MSVDYHTGGWGHNNARFALKVPVAAVKQGAWQEGFKQIILQAAWATTTKDSLSGRVRVPVVAMTHAAGQEEVSVSDFAGRRRLRCCRWNVDVRVLLPTQSTRGKPPIMKHQDLCYTRHNIMLRKCYITLTCTAGLAPCHSHRLCQAAR